MSERKVEASPDRRQFLAATGAAAGLSMFAGLDTGSTRAQDDKPPLVSAVVLGSAQDGGIPHAGCRCAHCQAARQDSSFRRRSPCLALLHHGERKVFLVDAGPDTAAQLDDLPADWKQPGARNPVDGVILSHAHIGHYTGLMYFGREVLGTSALPVYCSGSMGSFIRDNGPWSLLVDLGNIELRTIAPGSSYQLAADLSVEPFVVPHRAEFTDTLFFIIRGPQRRLLYLTDIDRWEGMDPPIEHLIERSDIALLDGTFHSPAELPGRDMSQIPHPPVVETAERLQGFVGKGGKRILFTHLNHSNLLLDADGVKLSELRNRGFDIACEGMSVAL